VTLRHATPTLREGCHRCTGKATRLRAD